MRKSLVLAIVGCAAVGAGCTANSYTRSADRQVQEILRDRTRTTVGYEPDVDTASTIDPTPSRRAYQKIPVTPLTPRIASALEPARIVVPFVPSGPPAPSSEPAAQTMPDPYRQQRMAQPGADSIVMGPPSPQAQETRLDLFGVLRYGVQHSPAYQSEMENLYLSALDVTLARHLFEPRPFANLGLSYTGGQADVDYRSALSATASAGIRQQLPYGGEIVAQGLVGFVNTLSGNVADGESAELALQGSLPLLRGAGMTNLEPLISSERRLIYQIRSFELYRRNFVVSLSQQYFNLLTLQQRVVNRQLNRQNLSILTEQTQALYEAGKISFLEVQQSLQSLLGAESSLIDEQESYQTAVDAFKIVLGMPIEVELGIVPVELDLDIPQISPAHAVELAMKYRLDLQTAADQIEDSQRSVAVAKNALLPNLNLTGGVNVGNRAGRPLVDLDSRTLTYNAGLSLDLPLDRVAERNTLRRQLISLQRSVRNLDQQQSQAAVAARDALRSIRSAQQNLRIQQLGIELAQRRLDYAHQRLIDGKAQARDLVEAQSSLLSAQDAYDRAKASLQNSILRFLNATGTLRVDPQAGALGRVMDRGADRQADRQVVGENRPG